MTSLYHRLGGFDQILALVRTWHGLCLQDAEAAHPFEHELHPQHDERLAAYLAEAFGGPALYTAGYGDESFVQRLHSGNGVHASLDEACIRRFDEALVAIGADPAAAHAASSYFRAATLAQRNWSGPDSVVPDALPFNYA